MEGCAAQGLRPTSHLPAGWQEAYCQPAMSWSAESSDEELMLCYRDGDAGAFDALYARHKGGVYRYLLRQCREAAAAEELFQDVWMNLVRARAGYTVQAKFTTYLYRLAHNRLIDHYRKHSHATVVSFEDEGEEAIAQVPDEHERPADDALDAKRQAARLMELIAGLPEAQREAFLMQQEGGMSIEEIAQATGVTRETAKSRLRYAMAKLRQGLRE
jgi:RNA polymerase sigma-70 factor (ECF subfamily)